MLRLNKYTDTCIAQKTTSWCTQEVIKIFPSWKCTQMPIGQVTKRPKDQLQITWLYLTDLQSCSHPNAKPLLLIPHVRQGILLLQKQPKRPFGSAVFLKNYTKFISTQFPSIAIIRAQLPSPKIQKTTNGQNILMSAINTSARKKKTEQSRLYTLQPKT